MKRASSPDVKDAKKRKNASQTGSSCVRQENEEALKHFALLKTSAREGTEDELQQVLSILKAWNLLDEYESLVASLMPEVYCLFKEISQEPQDEKSLTKRIPYIVEQIQSGKTIYQKGEESYAHLASRRFQYATVVSARMRGRIGITKEGDHDAICRLLKYWPPQDSDIYYAVKVCNKLNARWNPPYLTILPDAVLSNILGRLDMKGATSCFRTCKRLRATMLKELNWRPIDSSPSLVYEVTPLSGINELPTEVLINIFSFMDTYTLQACARTCQLWRQVALDNASIWTRNVTLGRDPWTVDRQWKEILRLVKDKKVTSISMDQREGESEEDYYDLKKNFQLLKTFPCDSLQEFSYTAAYTSDLYRAIWKKLHKCTQLKVIRFKPRGSYYGGGKVEVPRSSKLSKCRLQDILISSPDDSVRCFLDNNMITTLSEAKRISLDLTLSCYEVQRLLAVVKNTVQELRLGKIIEDYSPFYDDDESTGSTEEEDQEEGLDEDREQLEALRSNFVMTKADILCWLSTNTFQNGGSFPPKS